MQLCVLLCLSLKKGMYLIWCYGDTFGYVVQGPPLFFRLSDLHVHINSKGVPGAVTFTATLSQSARP